MHLRMIHQEVFLSYFYYFLLLELDYFYIKSENFAGKKNNINPISKEGAISLNNIFMLTLSFTILLGTIYPLFSSVIFNTKISVGAPFNSILAPITFPLVIGMIFGPFLKWGNDDLISLINRLKALLFIFLVIALFVWYLNYRGPILSIIFFMFSALIITSSLFELKNFISLKPKLKFKSSIKKYFTTYCAYRCRIINYWCDRHIDFKKRKNPISKS